MKKKSNINQMPYAKQMWFFSSWICILHVFVFVLARTLLHSTILVSKWRFQPTCGSFHENVTLKNGKNEMVSDGLWYPLSILLLAAIGAKLIGPHGGLQVDKQKVCQVTGSMEWPLSNISVTVSCVTDKRFVYRPGGHRGDLCPSLLWRREVG